jgi:hypothetical protein
MKRAFSGGSLRCYPPACCGGVTATIHFLNMQNPAGRNPPQ